jgi:hypothetical protein
MFVMVFKCFSGIFASVLDACFKCFISLLLYVAAVVFGCSKSRLGVTHGMHVGSNWRPGRRPEQRGQRPRRRGTTTGALPCEPDTLGAHSLPVRAAFRR